MQLIAKSFPEIRPLSDREKRSLKQSLIDKGQLVPVIYDRRTRVIADGLNRYRLMRQLKRRPLCEARDFESPEDIRNFALVVNTERRQLSPEQIEELRQWQRKTALKLRKEGKTQAQAAQAVGCSRTAVEKWEHDLSRNDTRVNVTKHDGRRTRLSLKDKQEICERFDDGETQEQLAADFDVSQKTVSRIIAAEEKRRQQERQRKEDAKKNEVLNQIVVGDFREHADKVADNSISLIFTDPPYSRDSAELLVGLADFAERKLVEGGSLLCYVGQTQLPEAMDALRTKLRYWWVIACLHSEKATMMREYAINAGWKPVLWFIKGSRLSKDMVSDVMSGGREKSHHKWQQSESEAAYWIEHLCPKDAIVCDPFLGGGTTAAAAKKLGRQWIGFEVDEQSARIASGRIK